MTATWTTTRQLVTGVSGDRREKREADKASKADRRREAAARRAAVEPLAKEIRATEALMDRIRKRIDCIEDELANPAVYEKDPVDGDAARQGALAACARRWPATRKNGCRCRPSMRKARRSREPSASASVRMSWPDLPEMHLGHTLRTNLALHAAGVKACSLLRMNQPRARSGSAIRPVRMIARRPARSMSSCSTTAASAASMAPRTIPTRPASICAKVARYADRIHHPDRLLKPLVRAGAKGEGAWKEASWEAALDLVAEKFITAEEKHGSETVWPYYYAGTMGLVQRDGIERLRHAKKYSGFFGIDLHQSGLDRLDDGHRRACAGPIRARWRSPIAW